jgi:guanosine-3',5'-bis(diphosphate) 3'-pyrophosphohydrolase
VSAQLAPLLDSLKAHNSEFSRQELERAFAAAENAHAGQLRKSGEDYITHPVAVAGILAELGMDQSTLIAALLHDTVEDTKLLWRNLKNNLGKRSLL